MLGSAHYEKGKYDKAIADYTEALRINPFYAEAWNKLEDLRRGGY
jgi:tetratricopeptide (TPR) repeat protein